MSIAEKISRHSIMVGVVVLLSIFLFELTLTVRRTSITWDEDDHIYAGYMSLTRGDFGLNPEHPPLVKQLAAIPLLSLQLKMPALENREFKHEAFLGGKDFIFRNDAETILFRARMAAALLTFLLAILVFLAGCEMFGVEAAFIALTLLVFDPNVLAHGAVVGTDMGLTCFMFAAIFAFYHYVRFPSTKRLIVVGLATGLTLASKHTGILLIPMLVMLSAAELFRKPENEQKREPVGKRAGRLAIAFVAISAIALTTLWAFYGFRYAARGAGLQLNPPFAQSVHYLSRPHEVRLLETVAHYHLLPESYLDGLADVRIMSDFYTSYLFGKIYPHGVWYYFPAAFAIKSTLPFLFLLCLAVWMIASRRLTGTREILFLTIPPAFHLFIAMSAGMNIGLRHILPMSISARAGSGGRLEDDRWEPALGLCRRVVACVAGGRDDTLLPGIHGVRERALGRAVADVQISQRLQCGLGTAIEVDEGLSGASEDQGMLVRVLRRGPGEHERLRHSLQAVADDRITLVAGRD